MWIICFFELTLIYTRAESIFTFIYIPKRVATTFTYCHCLMVNAFYRRIGWKGAIQQSSFFQALFSYFSFHLHWWNKKGGGSFPVVLQSFSYLPKLKVHFTNIVSFSGIIILFIDRELSFLCLSFVTFLAGALLIPSQRASISWRGGVLHYHKNVQ